MAELAPFVAVLGMHRSGTSALTRALFKLGFDAPPGDPLPGDEFNPRGYFESVDLIEILDEQLRRWNSTVFSPPQDSFLRHSSGDVELRVRLHNLFLQQSRIWIWKDPRLCLTSRIWGEEMDPKAAVLIWRQPQEVAASLERRLALPLDLGAALWFEYNHSALHQASGLPTFVIGLDALLADPSGQISRLAKFLSDIFPDLDFAWTQEAVDAIEPDLLTKGDTDQPMHDDDVILLDILRSAAGAHQTFAAPETPTLAMDRAALIEARRSAELELWDAKQVLSAPRVVALLNSTMRDRDIALADSVKRTLNNSVLRSLWRLIRRSKR